MQNRSAFHIFGQDGDAVAHLREGSVRLGRTLRQAIAIARYTQARIFVSQATATPEGKFIPTPGAERHYATPRSEASQQRQRRSQLNA